MKLHRLTLTNYRGIAHRDIEFADRGVVVVAGANEIGKTSMIEAIDLLLEVKDRSKHKDVKATKPTHADVGSEITAEISTGGYRFTYYKRFHKAPETVLTITEPRHEQLTGDEAHDRVRAILAETVDTSLWRAMRVLQASATTAVDLSKCDALSRALDLTAGSTGTLIGDEPALMERIDAEYGRYFTATGRPTGEWATALAAVHAAEQDLQRCRVAVDEIDEKAERHRTLAEQLIEAAAEQRRAEARYHAAEQQAADIDRLQRKLHEAKLSAETARERSDASRAAHDSRQQLRSDLEGRAAAVSELDALHDEAIAAQTIAQTAADNARQGLEAAKQLADSAEQRIQAARRAADQLATLTEHEQLDRRLAKITDAQHQLAQITTAITDNPMTDNKLAAIQAAAAACDTAAATLAATAATVELTAVADIELLVDGKPLSLTAGQSWASDATTGTNIELPGILTARVTPGNTGLDAHAAHETAQQALQTALAEVGACTLEAARDLAGQRRHLAAKREQLAATLDALRGDDNVETLQMRLAELQPTIQAIAPAAHNSEAIQAELVQADTQRADAATQLDNAEATLAAANAELTAKSSAAQNLQTKRASEQTELERLQSRLTQQRAEHGDSELAQRAETRQQQAETATRELAELTQGWTSAKPAQVTEELQKATAAADDARRHHQQIIDELKAIEVALAVLGTEGRHSRLVVAEAAHKQAAATHTQVGRRARAAQMLREVMNRHRDDARRRYVEPFRGEIERLGRTVFGESFTVDVDTDLRICTRTLDGRTVSYDALSGGAKEQLGILTRLAGAALVAKEDTVPVLIDDALGFTDPDRLAKMGDVLNTVGGDGQVIVLTCTPTRYSGVTGAQRIELT